MKNYFLLFLIPILVFNKTLLSQNSEKAGTLYREALMFYLDDKPEEACKEYIKAIHEENILDRPDYDFLGNCYEYAAEGKSEVREFAIAIELSHKALKEYRKTQNHEQTGRLILALANYYSQLQSYGQALQYSEQAFSKAWVAFRVDSVLGISNDTMWVMIDGGNNERIIPGEEGSAISIYTSEGSERGNIILGAAYQDESDLNSSICLVTLSNTNDPDYQVMKGDIIELLCDLPERDETFVISWIAQMKIQFNDIDSIPVFNQLEMLFNTDAELEDEIFRILVNDIHETWNFLLDYVADYPSWTEALTGGKYEGISMMDALKITTKSDIAAFLNFVIAYPGKYMGKSWKINETYATWLMNDTPLGEFDERMYKLILSLNGSEFDDYISENNFYIQDSTLDRYNQFIDDEFNAANFARADSLNNKLLRITEILGNDTYKSVFVVNKGLIKTNQEKWKESIQDFDDAIEIDPDNLNAYFFRGNSYGHTKDYYFAVKDYQKITDSLPELAVGYGNQGWYLLLDGKIFDAFRICKKAYDLDSSQLSYPLNLGHSYLLLGDTASARIYYDKSMELLSSRDEFYSGPMADLDIFIENGWQTELVQEAKSYMSERFNNDYEYYLLADSISDIAIVEKDEDEYETAVRNMLKSYEYEQQSKNPRPYWLYWETSWIGYIYQQMKKYGLAEKYYKESLHYAHDVLDDDAKTANIYDLLSWNAGQWGKRTEYITYLEKSEAYQRKYDNAGKSRSLYVLAVGNNEYKDLTYHFAERDAEILASVFSKNPANYYDSVSTQLILGKALTLENLEKAFRNVIVDSKPDDIFVFYLGGTGSLDTSNFKLNLPRNDSTEKTAAIDVNTIKTWLSSVQARNQFLMLDIFAPTFIDEFVGNYAISRGALAGSNLNLCILSLSGHRLEDDSLKHGLLSLSVIEVLQKGSELQLPEDKSLSIKDLNAHLFNQNNNNEGIISWNTYHTGNDFVLMNYDSLKLSDKRSHTITDNKRGVGSLNMDFGKEGGYSGESTNYAIIFATNEYDEWSNLINPVFDATAMAKTLRDFYGFEVELLTDNTRMDVLTKIREYQKKQYNPNDQLFIFFAGHGSFDEISGEGYIVCSDSKKDDEIKASYIPYSYLRENVNNIRTCNHILITLDVCFGGTFDKQVSKFGRGSDDYDQISKDAFISRAMQFKSRLFITSGSKEYVSDGDPGKHSPFAYRILDVLRSQGMMNGYVTYNTLVQSVERLQTTPRYGDFGDNEPGSEFIFSLEMQAPQRAFRVKDLK